MVKLNGTEFICNKEEITHDVDLITNVAYDKSNYRRVKKVTTIIDANVSIRKSSGNPCTQFNIRGFIDSLNKFNITYESLYGETYNCTLLNSIQYTETRNYYDFGVKLRCTS